MQKTVISDQTLIQQTLDLVHAERELLTQLLQNLRLIESRRLFSDLGYASLFEFTVKHLGYPEDQAHRRIQAMRLLRDFPPGEKKKVEEKLNQGALSLTHLSLAQNLFNKEKKLNNNFSVEQKIEVISKISHKATREAEKITLSFGSQPEVKIIDKVKVVSAEKIELQFTADSSIEEKIKMLKGRLAHKFPNLTTGELVEKLCDWGLDLLDPSQTVAKAKTQARAQALQNLAESDSNLKTNQTAAPRSDPKSPLYAKSGFASQSHVRRGVFQNAGNRCQICGSHHALEIDHIKPKAIGGTDEAENLRLLCRTCNQRAAIKNLGENKMNLYLQ